MCLRCCSFVVVDADGGVRLVAEAGQGRAATEGDEGFELGEHPEIAEAIRHRRMAGRAEGSVTALPALAGGRVHGVLELVRCEGRPALTAAQLQFAETLAETAVRALEPMVVTGGDGAGPLPRPQGGEVTLDQRLQEEFERARRYSLSFSLVLLEVADPGGAGEPGADAVQRLQGVLRLPDFVARYVTSTRRSSRCPTGRLDLSIYRYTARCYYEKVYIQGGNLIDRARREMGSTAFWGAMRGYVAARRYGMGSNRALLEALDAATSKDLGRLLFDDRFPSIY